MKTHTASEWADFFGFEVLDPDGWRSLKEDFNGPKQLSLKEFSDRLNESTISPTDVKRLEIFDFIC